MGRNPRMMKLLELFYETGGVVHFTIIATSLVLGNP